MAEELGKSERQVRSDMRTLEQAGLVRHFRRRNGRRSNTYECLWHPWFERQRVAGQKSGDDLAGEQGERQQTAAEVTGDLRRPAGRDRQDRANLSGSALPRNYVFESHEGNYAPDPTESSPHVEKTKNPSLRSKNNDDDQNAIAANDPEERLIRIIELWTKRMPDAKLVRDIQSTLVQRGASITQFLEDIGPRLKRLKEPPGEGFFLQQAREFGNSADAALGRRRYREIITAGMMGLEITASQNRGATRCAKCAGGGFLGVDPVAYCDCSMGVEVRRVAERKAAAAAPPDVCGIDDCA